MPLVCRRFRALSLAPQLLRELAINMWTPTAAKLRSLQRWLTANAHHAASLTLSMDDNADAAAIKHCLAKSCAAAPLQQLTVTSRELPSLRWLRPVRSTLRTLELSFYCSSSFFIDVPLQQLSMLQCLKLTVRGYPDLGLEFEIGCSLPTSLTYLKLASHHGFLPAEVRRCSAAGVLDAVWMGVQCFPS